MRLSELAAAIQGELDRNGDTEEVALCFVVKGAKGARRIELFGSVSVLHDTAEYPNGVAYLVAERDMEPLEVFDALEGATNHSA
jgi:hypothetical protein